MSGQHSITVSDPVHDTYDTENPRGGTKQAPLNPLVVGLGVVVGALVLALAVAVGVAMNLHDETVVAHAETAATVEEANDIIGDVSGQRDEARRQVAGCQLLAFVNQHLTIAAQATENAFEARRNENYPWMFKQTRKAEDAIDDAVQVRTDAGYPTAAALAAACSGPGTAS